MKPQTHPVSFPDIGEEFVSSSLLWGRMGGHGEAASVFSPVDGSCLQRAVLLGQNEIEELVSPSAYSLPAWKVEEVFLFAERLVSALAALRDPLLEAMQMETGFLRRDCEEMIEGSLEYVRNYRGLESHRYQEDSLVPLIYPTPTGHRQIVLQRVPWGTVAVILPQNAFLLLALTCLLNAPATGNRVILRAPLQSARSAALLIAAIEAAVPPANFVSVILAKARPFLQALYASPLPCLIHYLGSSRHAHSLLADAFAHGKSALVDGEGNTWMWIDATADVDAVARLLTEGATRYNGQTCTSINGAILHPSLYPAVRAKLVEAWNALKAGDPREIGTDIGPLFDETQTDWCLSQIRDSQGQVLCGGKARGNLMQPTLLERPSVESGLVREGLFGPALWIMPGDWDQFVSLWPRNRFPLCAGVLSQKSAQEIAAALPNTARLVLNGDPSQEYIDEPWGGYPASGANPVSTWQAKYSRGVQIDTPL